MKIGKMDKRIRLLRPIPTEDGYGGFHTDYEETGQIWAQVIQTNYAEQEAQGTPMNREQLRLRFGPERISGEGGGFGFLGRFMKSKLWTILSGTALPSLSIGMNRGCNRGRIYGKSS